MHSPSPVGRSTTFTPDHDDLMSTMTIGELRRTLADYDPHGRLVGVTAEHSSYSEGDDRIALAPGVGVRVLTLRKRLGVLVGRTMNGIRGETHPISDNTLIHLAHRGELGPAIVGVSADCTIIVKED